MHINLSNYNLEIGPFEFLMKLSPRYVMVTCLTHGDGFGGRGRWGSWTQWVGVGGAKHPGEGRVQRFGWSPGNGWIQDGGRPSRMAGVEQGAGWGRMDNLRRDEEGELVMFHFDRFCACMHDLGKEEKTWVGGIDWLFDQAFYRHRDSFW